MTACIDIIRSYSSYIAIAAAILLILGGYGAIKLKDFIPVLKTILSPTQTYPLGTWNCMWKHESGTIGQMKTDISDVVRIEFAREDIVIGSGSGGAVQDGYQLVGRCTSSCLSVTYKISDRDRPYAGAVVLHKVNEKRLEGWFVQYLVAADGKSAGLALGTTVWTKP